MEDNSTDNAAKGPERAAGEIRAGTYVFQLYVSGITPKSLQAIENIKALCEEHLRGRYELQIIDVYRNPEQTRDARIVAAPTLIKQLPAPLRRFVGNLADKEHILFKLDLIPHDSSSELP
ncbi:MAG: circadian clock KaiB family protein [Desulfobacteraceae bacterium]|nr:circadian clock KaiB family protein [Desulfobacteraceae bacterium]